MSMTTKLSYKDVLHPRTQLGHIDRMFAHATALGYPYFLWNSRVYEVVINRAVVGYQLTALTAADVV